MTKWLFPAGCLVFAILIGLPGAIYAPDAAQYRLLALGERSEVPAPFSARILGPAIAGWLGRMTGLGADRGFLLLGAGCLLALIAAIAAILWSWRAPTVLFAGIFLMPFWVDIFHDYYLPDLLHATILAAIVVCLLRGHTTLALLLLFPAYLARESTLVVELCLVFAGWRRIPLRAFLAGAMAVLAAIAVSRHYGLGAAPSVHGVDGAAYLAGKLIWSFCKNVLALPLYSNTLQECNPIWTTTLPHPIGEIRTVGLCRPSLWGPERLLLAWLGIFGVGPALALVLWRKIVSRTAFSGLNLQLAIGLRFCLVYGLISILMTPLLGASADRLVEYGWPFYFVALPWFLPALHHLRSFWILALHLGTCWLAWFGFRQQSSGFLLAGASVLVLNGIVYALAKRGIREEATG